MDYKITLIDLVRNEERTWSPYCWLAKLCLNRKNLNYDTEWVEIYDIASTVSKFGIPANENFPHYTLPALKYTKNGSTQYLMGSDKIAALLEKEFPEPALRLRDPLTTAAMQLRTELGAMFGIYGMARTPLFLGERAAKYYEETKIDRVKRPFAEIRKEWEDRQDKDELIATGRAKFNQFLSKNASEGPFLTGSEPIFADLILIAALNWSNNLDDFTGLTTNKQDDAVQRFWEASEALRKQ